METSVRIWWDRTDSPMVVQTAHRGAWVELEANAEPGFETPKLPRGTAIRVGNSTLNFSEPVYVPWHFSPADLSAMVAQPDELLAGTVGFSALGTLLTSMTASLKGREVLLPILLFPLMVPGLLSLVNLTAYLFFDTRPEQVDAWWNLLLGFDVLLLVVSILGFEFVMEE